MKKIILILISLLITSSLFASEASKCALKAQEIVSKDGFKAISDKYSVITGGLTEENAIVIYIFPVSKKDGEIKKIAAVGTGLNCDLFTVNYYDEN